MALLLSSPHVTVTYPSSSSVSHTPLNSNCSLSSFAFRWTLYSSRRLQPPITVASHLCTTTPTTTTPTTTTTTTVDTSLLNVAEAFSEDQLWAASCLRVRSFYNFAPTAYAIHVSPLNAFFSFLFCSILSNSITKSNFEIWVFLMQTPKTKQHREKKKSTLLCLVVFYFQQWNMENLQWLIR